MYINSSTLALPQEGFKAALKTAPREAQDSPKRGASNSLSPKYSLAPLFKKGGLRTHTYHQKRHHQRARLGFPCLREIYFPSSKQHMETYQGYNKMLINHRDHFANTISTFACVRYQAASQSAQPASESANQKGQPASQAVS